MATHLFLVHLQRMSHSIVSPHARRSDSEEFVEEGEIEIAFQGAHEKRDGSQTNLPR